MFNILNGSYSLCFHNTWLFCIGYIRCCFRFRLKPFLKPNITLRCCLCRQLTRFRSINIITSVFNGNHCLSLLLNIMIFIISDFVWDLKYCFLSLSRCAVSQLRQWRRGATEEIIEGSSIVYHKRPDTRICECILCFYTLPFLQKKKV